MALLSASVFVIDRRLFWGFNDDRNGIVVVGFFVVVIVHVASVVKPLLLCSLLYSQTSKFKCPKIMVDRSSQQSTSHTGNLTLQ